MDNLAAHKNTDVAEALHTRGAQLCYLPPYSPDYNPIEPAWSKIKTWLRGVGARTRRTLSRSLRVAISPSDRTRRQGLVSALRLPRTLTSTLL